MANEADIASYSEKELFRYLKRIKLIAPDAKFEDWKGRKTEMLSLVYYEISDIS